MINFQTPLGLYLQPVHVDALLGGRLYMQHKIAQSKIWMHTNADKTKDAICTVRQNCSYNNENI